MRTPSGTAHCDQLYAWNCCQLELSRHEIAIFLRPILIQAVRFPLQKVRYRRYKRCMCLVHWA